MRRPSRRRSPFRPRSHAPRAATTSRRSRSTPDDFSRRDIEFHRITAGAYDEEVTSEYAVYHERLLSPFLDRVAEACPQAKALDLGCGTGVVTVALARRGMRVTGIDHSPEMLDIARRKLADAGLEAVLETGDVRALRFGDREFDCVTVQGLLHHLEEPSHCLSEVSRVLRRGGFFYVSEPCRDETPVKRLLRAVWSRLPKRRAAAVVEPLVESVEQPISARDLRTALDDLGLAYEIEFMTHIPPLRRRLPDRLYLAVSRALSLPWRRRRGDLVFVFGAKR